jgi:hypothetical protein
MQSVYDDVYQDLANAIVLQAVTDYRNALNGISYNRFPPEKIANDCEKFFKSDYYRMLTKVKGEYLIETLKKEHLENERRKDESYSDTSNT